jgi:gluconolactonase
MTAVTQLATGLAWPEGPTALPDGRVVFVETYRSQVSYWAPGGETGVFAATGGGPNATALGSDGAVYLCQNGGVVGPWRASEMREPSIQRILPSGEVETVATEIAGVRFQAPNDLAFGPNGRLYFTDPGRYDAAERPDPGYVFALDPDGGGELVAEVPPVYPNGVVVEAAGTVVWVESYTRAVKRRHADGGVEEVAVLEEGHLPDGLAVAADGSLYVTTVTSGGVDVGRPDGRVDFLAVGSVPTNCAFSGSTLYVTDGGHPGESSDAAYAGVLWAVELVGVEGQPLFAGPVARA